MDFIQKNQDDVYSRMKNLNSSLNQVLRDLQSFSEHDLTGELDSTLSYIILFFSITHCLNTPGSCTGPSVVTLMTP